MKTQLNKDYITTIINNKKSGESFELVTESGHENRLSTGVYFKGERVAIRTLGIEPNHHSLSLARFLNWLAPSVLVTAKDSYKFESLQKAFAEGFEIKKVELMDNIYQRKYKFVVTIK